MAQKLNTKSKRLYLIIIYLLRNQLFIVCNCVRAHLWQNYRFVNMKSRMKKKVFELSLEQLGFTIFYKPLG